MEINEAIDYIKSLIMQSCPCCGEKFLSHDGLQLYEENQVLKEELMEQMQKNNGVGKNHTVLFCGMTIEEILELRKLKEKGEN